MKTTQIQILQPIKKYNKVIVISFLSIILYYLAAVYNHVFNSLMSVVSFLTWHTVFELSSVFISFSIFTVTYFIYEESKNLKMILYGCAFLFMGLLDAFHTLSFKGMPIFFIENDTANRSTIFWVLSRFIGSLIFLKALTLDSSIVVRIRKEAFASIIMILTFILFYVVTYHSDVLPPMYITGTGLTNFKIFLEYLIIFIIGLTFFIASSRYRKTNSKKMYNFMVALVLLIFSEFAFTKYGNVYDAFNYIGHVYKILAFSMFYKALYLEYVSLPYQEMKQSKSELKLYSDNLNIIVKQRTAELENSNAELSMDIEYAKEMQRFFLPLQMPQNSSVSFDVEYLAANSLSGDFYNVINLDENNIAIYIGDVSGHGIPAAMLTIFAYKNTVQLTEKSYGQFIEPGVVLKSIYKSFNQTNINDEKFILMLYGIYNTLNKSFMYSSAGMNAPPYIIKQSGEIVEMDVNGFPICKLGDLVSPYYENLSIQLETGDKILFYTDGLVEAKNENGELYGSDRLKSFLSDNYHLNSSDLKTAIKNEFYKHIGYESLLMDDVTFLSLNITG